MSTRNLIIGLSLLLLFIFTIQLVTDDELSPEAKKWLDYYSQEPNLEQNAFIELIALGQDTPNAYQTAKQMYHAAVEKFHNGNFEYDSQLKYPAINKLPAIVDNPIYCTFEKPDCFTQLTKNKEIILNELQPFEDKLTKFRQLAFYSNFDFLNPLVTEPQFEVTYLYQLSGIQAYYLITAGQLNKAATLIANLIKLERKFLQASSNVMFIVSTVVHSQNLYTPLIQELHIRGFNNWHEIQSALTPFKISEISANRLRLQEFASSARILQFVNLTKNALEQTGVTNHYLGKLVFKENITINKLSTFTQAQLIDEAVDKSKLLEQIKLAEKRKTQVFEQLEQDIDNLYWTLIKNYRNVAGTLTLLISPEPLLDLYQDTINADLRLLLLNALIQSQITPIQDIIDSPKFINPYTGEKAFFSDNKICYQIDSPVCIKTSF